MISQPPLVDGAQLPALAFELSSAVTEDFTAIT